MDSSQIMISVLSKMTIQHVHVYTHCGLCRFSWSLFLGAGCGLDVWRIAGFCVCRQHPAALGRVGIQHLQQKIVQQHHVFSLHARQMLDSFVAIWTTRKEKRQSLYLHDQEEQSDRWEGSFCEITTVCSGTWGVGYVRAASADGRAGWTVAERTGPFWRCSKPERQSQSPAASEPSHDSAHLQESVTSLNSYLLISTKQDEIWCR